MNSFLISFYIYYLLFSWFIITFLSLGFIPSETETKPILISNNTIYLRVKVKKGGICSFFYSLDDKNYQPIGNDFTSIEGKWIGAKMGLFALSEKVTNDSGNVAVDWFRVTK